MNKLESSLRQISTESADRLAVQFRDRRLSYRQLTNILDSLTERFGQLAGRRILLLLPDGIPSYLFHLHSFLSGAILVPVSIQSTTSKIRALCERVQPHFVVTNTPLRSRHKTAIATLPCLVVKSDATHDRQGFDYEDFGLKDVLSNPRQTAEVMSQEARMIVFTSGSTGEPKGVCLSETNLLAAASMMVSFLALEPSRKSLVTVPLYDYYGFIQIYGHILGQCGYIFGESIGLPDQLFRRIREEQVSDLVLVPHTLREMLRIIGNHDDVIRHLKYMTSSSDVLTPDILMQVFDLNPDLKVFNIYGLTEAGRACYREIDRSFVHSTSIGRPSVGVDIIIEGPEGEAGEIIIRGPNVMLGYLKDICDDRIVFDPCQEVRTGDIAYYDKNGEIILVGRRDHMINIRGSKIHPAEIESIALQIPDVIDVLARKHTGSGGEIEINLDVVLGDSAFNLETLRAHLRRNLPPLFFPKEVNIVSNIKRTELGSKIIR
jgi:long-chain acyl-CoA synthetase